jgi:hypothetical protein
MGDIRRIVHLTPGGKPVVDLDLNVSPGYTAERGTFTHTPGSRQQSISGRGGRFSPGRVVGEARELGRVAWTAMLDGTTGDQINLRMEDLLSEVESLRWGRLLEWRPEGASYSSFFRIVGPGEWRALYEWPRYVTGRTIRAEVSWPTEPLVEWAPMSIYDSFDPNSSDDYTFDALTVSSLVWPSGPGPLAANGQLTSERRVLHTSRGYSYAEGQATVKTTPAATITNYKAGVILRRANASNYVEVYVDDNGTNSRLRIDIIVAGARTNRQSTNLAARLANGTEGWIRARIVGTTVSAEWWLGAPTPLGAPTLAPTGYTLTSGELGATGGTPGFVWIPQHASATLDDFEFAPYVRRNVTVPDTSGMLNFDAVPGTAPCKASVTITHSASPAPRWALISFLQSPGTPLAGSASPLGIFDAAATLSGGWVYEADASGSLGGSRLRETAGVSGVENYYADWLVDPHTLVADDFAIEEIDLEVWARVLLDSTLISPQIFVWFEPSVASMGAARNSHEFGSTGRLLTKPTSLPVWRFVKAGTYTLPVNADQARTWRLKANLSCAAGSSGNFGLDYLLVVPARSRALGPTGVVYDGYYPDFITATTQASKTIHHDLSGALSEGSYPTFKSGPDHGLGGNLITVDPGPFTLAVKLSSTVPDDPTSNNESEAVSHAVSVRVDSTPRSYLLRG